MAYKRGFISYSELKSNGWTDRLIEDLLGPPNKFVTNKYNVTGPKVRLYDVKRVKLAEQTVLFQNHCNRSHPTKESAVISDFFA